ncbi:MAG: hypothetical protein MJZ20_05355 [Bacteroidaceae bacterium]|nr:hypothetical protein [Bacteroidaceae bacterium]
MPILLATIIMLLQACSKGNNTDEPTEIWQSLISVTIGPNKTIESIITDNGKTWIVTQEFTTDFVDTTIRCLAKYKLLDNSSAHIYSLKSVFANTPVKASSYKEKHTDPVKFTSAWKGGGYLNLGLILMTHGEGTHKFAFCEDSIATNNAGQKIAYFTFLHQKPVEDTEDYSETRYFCLPLKNYLDCDSVKININTYSGIKIVQR